MATPPVNMLKISNSARGRRQTGQSGQGNNGATPVNDGAELDAGREYVELPNHARHEETRLIPPAALIDSAGVYTHPGYTHPGSTADHSYTEISSGVPGNISVRPSRPLSPIDIANSLPSPQQSSFPESVPLRAGAPIDEEVAWLEEEQRRLREKKEIIEREEAVSRRLKALRAAQSQSSSYAYQAL